MDFKVKSSIAVDVATHVFKFSFTPDTNDYQHYSKIKKLRYCWGIGVYAVLPDDNGRNPFFQKLKIRINPYTTNLYKNQYII